MRNLLNKYLTGASMIALTFSLNTSTANATCSAMPTCEELGYNRTSCDSGQESIKCPFDTTKMKCLVDSCYGYYPSSENGECYPGIGELTYCSTNGVSKCRYTSCYKYFYNDPSSGETGLVWQDGKCVEATSSEACPSFSHTPYYLIDDDCTCNLGGFLGSGCLFVGNNVPKVGDVVRVGHVNGADVLEIIQKENINWNTFNLMSDMETSGYAIGIVYEVNLTQIKMFTIIKYNGQYMGDPNASYTLHSTLESALADMDGEGNTAKLASVSTQESWPGVADIEGNCDHIFWKGSKGWGKCYLASAGEFKKIIDSGAFSTAGNIWTSWSSGYYLTSSIQSKSGSAVAWVLDSSANQGYSYNPTKMMVIMTIDGFDNN